MRSLIRGRTVKLYEQTQTGTDDFNHPVYSETVVEVENVLIEPASNEAVTSEYDINGKHISYILHIPKGDAHTWANSVVELPDPWNTKVKTYGDCLIYDTDLTPLAWDKKIKVENYE